MDEYKDLFLAEAQEYLQNMTSCLLELEKDPGQTDYLSEMFRSAHSLKGMAGTMGFELITALTHDMENLLDQLRSGTIEVGTGLVTFLFESSDLVQLLVDNLDDQEAHRVEVEEMRKRLQEWQSFSAEIHGMKEKEAGEEQKDQTEVPPGETEPGHSASTGPSGHQDAGEPSPETSFHAVDLTKDLNEFEKEMLKEAASKGEGIYSIHVWLLEGSLLKSVRAYMVYKAVEKYGEIVKSVPSVQELEDEQFDRDFYFVLMGDANVEGLRLAIEGIAEVEKVEIRSLDLQEETAGAACSGALSSDAAAGMPFSEQPGESAQEPQAERAQREKVAGLQEEAGEAKASNAKAASPLNRAAEKTVRVETAKLDSLVNLVGELIINRTRVVELGKKFEDENLGGSLEQLERITTELQNAVMTLRMVPIKQVFDRFPRMVRDLSVEENKEISLTVAGEETELDRTIVNQIGDPLVHLLRNAVDHGIEKPEDRKKRGKDPAGQLLLEAHHEGSHVVVSVEDDGEGIDPEKVKEKAVSKGVATREEVDKLSDDEAIRLIFRSGFSIADRVTDVSGRGVGMDVVKTAIESLNGTVEVKSELGEGTRFILRLPLTLAIIKTLMVRAGGEIYAVPVEAIRENLFVEPHEIKSVQQDRVITLREEVLPLYCLEEQLGIGFFVEKEEYPVVVVHAGEKKAGLIVDELMGQQEVVIKSLSSFINDIRGIAGATVLGDGRVTLILDVASLLEDGRVNVGKESVNHG